MLVAMSSKMPRSELNEVVSHDVPQIMFVVTTPFAVNAFLANHIAILSRHYRVILCTNLDAYDLLPSLFDRADVRHIPFARKIAPITDFITLFQLLAVVRLAKPVAIHSITPKAGLLAMMAGWIARVPNRWHTFTGQTWVTKKGLGRRLLKALDRLIVQLSSQVFADSASQCRLLRDAGVVGRSGIDMLGSGSIAGVDLNRFHPDAAGRERLRQQIGTGTDSCVFLYVGRLARDKGVFDLVQAFRQVATAVQDVELWVVGPDEEGLLHALQETAVGCEAPIRWLGATTTPEHFMAAADVLLLPSYREGFGSVIIEGAACGIPAIAYRIDGVIDAMAEGSSGLLVEFGQLTALATAMKSLAHDRGLRLHLGSQARERAEREFSSVAVTEAWRDYYLRQLR
jgi:glycosyltransferase involved in cell wall biosynthesis